MVRHGLWNIFYKQKNGFHLNKIPEYHIYQRLACAQKSPENREVLEKIAQSVAKDAPFRRRFLEMAAVSLGVAGLSFILGYLIRSLLGVEI